VGTTCRRYGGGAGKKREGGRRLPKNALLAIEEKKRRSEKKGGVVFGRAGNYQPAGKGRSHLAGKKAAGQKGEGVSPRGGKVLLVLKGEAADPSSAGETRKGKEFRSNALSDERKREIFDKLIAIAGEGKRITESITDFERAKSLLKAGTFVKRRTRA